MKKFVKVFAMAAAVAAFGFGFTSCDDKDDSDSKEVFSIVFTKVADKSDNYDDYYISEVINFEVEDEKREAAPEDDEEELRMYMKFSKSNEPRGVAAPEKYGWVFGSVSSIDNDSFELPMFRGDYVSTGNIYTLDVISVNNPGYTANGITENWISLPSILTGWKKITINNDSFALTISEDDPLVPFFDSFAGE